MKGFRKSGTVFAVLVSSAVATADDPGIFIPWAPLDASEIAAERDRMKRTPGLNDSYVEQALKDEMRFHKYRDADIIAAFPEVRGHAKVSACTNSMMSGATEFVFVAGKRRNRASIESIRCAAAPKGLKCWPLERETRYFLDGKEQYFTLEGLTFAKAKDLLESYTAGRVSSLPGEMRHQPTNISFIKAMPDGQFMMIFGDYLCAGCVTKMIVKPESVNGITRLQVIGAPETGCI